MINKAIRWIYFRIIVRTVVVVVLGLNVRNRDRLPNHGPAIVVANHNSHLDTMVLMTLLPWRLLDKVRPVAAMDYFMQNGLLAWFALKIIGILPIARKSADRNQDPLAECRKALDTGEILILFPEGSRGEPEELSSFKTGIARLAESNPQVPITPVFMHGLGKALPKGEGLLVPFFCDTFVGEPIYWNDQRDDFMKLLDESMKKLSNEEKLNAWE